MFKPFIAFSIDFLFHLSEVPKHMTTLETCHMSTIFVLYIFTCLHCATDF